VYELSNPCWVPTSNNGTLRVRGILEACQRKNGVNADDGKFVTKTTLHSGVDILIKRVVDNSIVTKSSEETINELTDSESHGFVTCLVMLQTTQ
jgi:hypothetical protein